jgi:hypothetical protein
MPMPFLALVICQIILKEGRQVLENKLSLVGVQLPEQYKENFYIVRKFCAEWLYYYLKK